MRILPVIDLQNGLVVRGVAGRRQEYRPLVSQLTSSCQALEVARAFRDRLGLNEVYLADLDAIAGGPPSYNAYADIQCLGISLWLDAGIREASMAAPLARAGIERIVLGLETIAAPTVLEEVGREWGFERIVFSLDLRDGTPIGNAGAWEKWDAWSIAVRAIQAGIKSMILLDLARVGMGSGTGTEELGARLAHAFPEVEGIVGGGIRGLQDLLRLKAIGIRRALVASALHDGRLSREESLKL